MCAFVRLGWQGYREKSAQLHELDVDPTGFARGEVEPGTLHAKGELFDNHKVPFSVGLAGKYHLHVRLRQEALPLPGSPFALTVVAGKPAAYLSMLLDDIHAFAGKMATATVQACDIMGNACKRGGTALTVSSTPPVQFEINDMDDGTYEIEWRAVAGKCEIDIKLDGVHIMHSPFTVDGGVANSRGQIRRSSTLQKLDQLNAAMASKKTEAAGPKAGPSTTKGGKKVAPVQSNAAVSGTESYNSKGSFRGRSSGLSTKAATVAEEPRMRTRHRMSLGMSGMTLPDSVDSDPLALRAVQAAQALHDMDFDDPLGAMVTASMKKEGSSPAKSRNSRVGDVNGKSVLGTAGVAAQ